MNKNNNLFAGDRGYKTNFFLKFRSPRIEEKFRDDTFIRSRFTIQGFLFFSMLLMVIHFMFSDCYVVNNYCRHEILLLFCLSSFIAAFICLHFKLFAFSVRIAVILASVYIHVAILDQFSSHVSSLLMIVYTSIASFLLCQVWYLALLYNLLSCFVLLAYLIFTENLYLIRSSFSDFTITLALYNFVHMVSFAFIEKARRERWVLVDSFKRSERIFRAIYEKLPYSFFVLDRNKRIHYTNTQGLDVLMQYFPNCKSCDLQKINVNIQEILQEKYISKLDEALEIASNEQNSTCFISLKVPVEVRGSNPFYNFEADNQYKVLINPINWKNNYAYLIAIKNYSSKVKSEKIAAKAFNYLVKRMEHVIDYYDDQASEKQQKFKLKMLSQLSKFKQSILSTILMFNRMFNKNQFLSGKKNFNIRQNVLTIMGVMSMQAKEHECDLQVTFESSFPETVCGDEYLFQQIFSNLLKMLLDKVRSTKIVVQCGLQEVLPENLFLLSFEFEVPKNDALSYETVSAKAEAAKKATLDHLLDDDEVSFYLALIRPALELFDGKILTDEAGNKFFIKIEVPFQGVDNTKDRSVLRNSTLKSCNFNVSGQSRTNTYQWNHQEPENERENIGPELEVPTTNSISSQKNHTSGAGSKSNLDDSKHHSKERVPGMFRIENRKIREELQKMSAEGGNKNFGSSNDAKSQLSNSMTKPKTDSIVGKKSEDNGKSAKSKQNSIVVDEEEKDGRESTKETEKGRKSVVGLPTEEDHKGEKEKDDILIIDGESMSLETLEKLSESVKFHERQLKLAVTKTLLGILDSFEKKQSKNEKQEEYDSDVVKTFPILREVGEQIKATGLNESEMYKRVLGHLRDNLANQKFRDNFVKFMREYRKQVEDEIYSLQVSNESDALGSLSDLPPETLENLTVPDSPDMLRRALSLNEKKLNTIRGTKGDLMTPPGSEKSKGRSLNERFLLTPSVSKTIKLQGIRSPFQRPAIHQFAEYFSGILGKGRSSQNIEEFKQNLQESDHFRLPEKKSGSFVLHKPTLQEADQIEDMKKKLIPPGSSAFLPDFALTRVTTHKRRWTGKPNETDNLTNAEEKSFAYNKVFTILAVDDSEFVFRGLEALPARFDRKFDYAKNGTEALKKYLHNINQGILYHLVLMDLQMPVMDGFETARNIRAEENDKNYPRTYVCAMSAFEDQDTINKAKREGMDNFCQKPLRVEVLNNLMRTRMEQVGTPLPE